MELIARNLKETRERRGFSQQELADKVKLSRTTIANIEQNIYDPKIKTLQDLASVLGVHIKEFFN